MASVQRVLSYSTARKPAALFETDLASDTSIKVDVHQLLPLSYMIGDKVAVEEVIVVGWDAKQGPGAAASKLSEQGSFSTVRVHPCLRACTPELQQPGLALVWASLALDKADLPTSSITMEPHVWYSLAYLGATWPTLHCNQKTVRNICILQCPASCQGHVPPYHIAYLFGHGMARSRAPQLPSTFPEAHAAGWRMAWIGKLYTPDPCPVIARQISWTAFRPVETTPCRSRAEAGRSFAVFARMTAVHLPILESLRLRQLGKVPAKSSIPTFRFDRTSVHLSEYLPQE
jgi:hypothetical protein